MKEATVMGYECNNEPLVEKEAEALERERERERGRERESHVGQSIYHVTVGYNRGED